MAARDHGLTVGDGVFEVLKVVDGRTFALDPHLDRLTRSAGGSDSRTPTSTPVRRGVAAVLDGEPLAARPGPGHLDRRARRRSAPTAATARRRWWSSRRRWTRGPTPRRSRPCPGPATSGRARRPQDHVVRRERARPGPAPGSGAPARRSSPTSRVISARAPAPTSSTSSTASCAPRPWPAGCLAGITRAPDPRVVRRHRGRRADRGAGRRRARRSWPPPPATSRPIRALGRPRPRAPGPVTTEVRKVWHEREAELLGR